jgi:type II restriction enzyme
MRRAIEQGLTPNLLALHYDPVLWEVRSLLLIPKFAFSLRAIEVRKPLSPSARRKGWVGCDIALDKIPPDARIPIVFDGRTASQHWVRRQYDRLRPLARSSPRKRGWTLDVLNVVRGIGKQEFRLDEVYAHAAALKLLHPGNRHVEAKIRQQLQRLRDLGVLEFVGRGRYEVRG